MTDDSADWEVVETVGTEEEAALIAGYLDSQGIPTTIESLLFHQEPVNFGRLGEIRIQVPSNRLAEAEQLLAKRDAAPLEAEGQLGESGDAGSEAGAAAGEEDERS
jgi:hypothetical protein